MFPIPSLGPGCWLYLRDRAEVGLLPGQPWAHAGWGGACERPVGRSMAPRGPCGAQSSSGLCAALLPPGSGRGAAQPGPGDMQEPSLSLLLAALDASPSPPSGAPCPAPCCVACTFWAPLRRQGLAWGWLLERAMVPCCAPQGRPMRRPRCADSLLFCRAAGGTPAILRALLLTLPGHCPTQHRLAANQAALSTPGPAAGSSGRWPWSRAEVEDRLSLARSV